MKRNLLLVLVLILIYPSIGISQATKSYTSSEIFEAIQRLQVLGSVLYVAAHPDDENTSMISYLNNEKKYETTYLSITRGDGGQNLIGSETQELLGVIRTQELLAARRVDGGNQMFTRANDFGYSKNPTETLEFWNKEAVLSDVVWAIRKLQPDIIINRFSNDPNSRTHGHHTSSAMLSTEAFDMTNRTDVYPDQLSLVEPWQAKRLFWNTSRFFFGSQWAELDKSKLVAIDVGVYYPLKGKSNTEISAESRSQHRCQGMGRTSSRGQSMEYLDLLKGQKADKDLFDGINTSWSRIRGGELIGEALKTLEDEFDFSNPSQSISELVRIQSMISDLPDSRWKRVKLEEIEEVIVGSLGLFTEVIASDYSSVPGENIDLKIEIINRSPMTVEFKKIVVDGFDLDSIFNEVLTMETPFKISHTAHVPDNMSTTNAYWLKKKGELGRYTVDDQSLRGLPETPRANSAKIYLEINNQELIIERPLVYKRTDRVKGEIYRPYEIIAPVSVTIENAVEIFVNNTPRKIKVGVKAGKNNCAGSLALAIPKGWLVSPESTNFSLQSKGEKAFYEFELTPPSEQSTGLISPMATINGKTYVKEEILIEYDHIPTQTIYQHSEAKVAKIDIRKVGNRIGYIMGPGDEVPASLIQMGYDVDLLTESDIQGRDLEGYDAIVVGIRAYNTNLWMKYQQSRLMEYVEKGGTMIVQFNTTRGLPISELGPYPFKLSRDRVSVEEAEVRILEPNHKILNWPNKISDDDFDDWIQERGVYFANEWDSNYTPILSANDPNEPPRDGGLLVAKYGTGHYIYTGYAWFRQLPAGVPGAYRIFANMVSIGKADRP